MHSQRSAIKRVRGESDKRRGGNKGKGPLDKEKRARKEEEEKKNTRDTKPNPTRPVEHRAKRKYGIAEAEIFLGIALATGPNKGRKNPQGSSVDPRNSTTTQLIS